MRTVEQVKKEAARRATEHEQLKLSYLEMERELDAMRNKFETFYNEVVAMRKRQEALKEAYDVTFSSELETKVDQKLQEVAFFLFEKPTHLKKVA